MIAQLSQCTGARERVPSPTPTLLYLLLYSYAVVRQQTSLLLSPPFSHRVHCACGGGGSPAPHSVRPRLLWDGAPRLLRGVAVNTIGRSPSVSAGPACRVLASSSVRYTICDRVSPIHYVISGKLRQPGMQSPNRLRVECNSSCKIWPPGVRLYTQVT